MMPSTSDIGVIVGRFQVHRLHDAHLALIRRVYETHPQTLIVLGLSQAKCTIRNPLDFEARKVMILTAFPKATVLYQKDEASDQVWSKKLDELIEGYINPGATVCLYGGRDGFHAHYHGKFPVVEFEPTSYVSGTEQRRTITRAVRTTEDFRAGVIWATANAYPRVHMATDVAVMKDHAYRPDQLLLVRKPNETLWRFPGGFVHPADASLEFAAARELHEETGVEAGDYQYVSSTLVDDWRYRKEVDKVMTVLFRATFVHGPIRPADDVAEAQWHDVTSDTARVLVFEHQPLWSALVRTFQDHQE